MMATYSSVKMAVLLMSILWTMLPWDNTTYYGQYSCLSSNNCIQHRKGCSTGPCNSIYNSSNTIRVRLNAINIFKNNLHSLPMMVFLAWPYYSFCSSGDNSSSTSSREQHWIPGPVMITGAPHVDDNECL